MRNSRKAAAVMAIVGALVSTVVAGQSYPDRPISLVIAFTAGGTTDIVGREYAKRLSAKLGQSVVVENKPGGSGNIGVQSVVRSNPDGYTLMMGNFGPLVVNPALNPDLKFDARTDLTPISPLVAAPNVLVVAGDSPLNSFDEFVAWAKKQPAGKVTYASTGIGTAAHLSSHALMSEIGSKGSHIPYKGSGGLVDIIAGRVDFTMATAPSILSMLEAGKLKALLVTGETRLPTLPKVPAAAEYGLDKPLASAWYGVYGPPNLPEAVKQRINRETADMLKSPEFIERMTQLGAVVAKPQTPHEYSDYLTSEIARMKRIVPELGVTNQ